MVTCRGMVVYLSPEFHTGMQSFPDARDLPWLRATGTQQVLEPFIHSGNGRPLTVVFPHGPPASLYFTDLSFVPAIRKLLARECGKETLHVNNSFLLAK